MTSFEPRLAGARTSRTVNMVAHAVAWAIALLVAMTGMEVVLRSSPDLISIEHLERFPPRLRERLASARGLPTTGSRPVIDSTERSDGGPDLHLHAPSRSVLMPAAPEDIELGAIESIPMDAKGFCNAPAKADRQTADVLVLGDSFSWCVGTRPEDAASSYLEDITSLAVYNLSIPGIGPYEELELLRRFGLDLRPRYVVLNLYEGNDLRDVGRFLDFKLKGKLKDRGESKEGILSWSFAVSYLDASIQIVIRRVKAWASADFRYSVVVDEKRVPMNVQNSDIDEVRNARRMIEGKITPDLLAEPISNLGKLAVERGFSPIVTYIPSAYTAYQRSVQFSDPGTGEAVQRASEAQRNWLSRHASNLGVTYIDFTPAFQDAAANGGLTHFPATIHLTPRGHRVVAEGVAALIGNTERQ
jgi:hypothetical protein